MNLKSCPFCGGTNIVMRDVSGLFGKSACARTYHYMQCRDCMSQTGYHGTKPKTIEAWNRRAWVIDSDYDVTHWMPLPQPPKEGE